VHVTAPQPANVPPALSVCRALWSLVVGSRIPKTHAITDGIGSATAIDTAMAAAVAAASCGKQTAPDADAAAGNPAPALASMLLSSPGSRSIARTGGRKLVGFRAPQYGGSGNRSPEQRFIGLVAAQRPPSSPPHVIPRPNWCDPVLWPRSHLEAPGRPETGRHRKRAGPSVCCSAACWACTPGDQSFTRGPRSDAQGDCVHYCGAKRQSATHLSSVLT
jgi:hypothetical protein